MVEEDVIYEEIQFQKQPNGDQQVSSNQMESSRSPDDYLRNSLYEDMNGLCEKLEREYNINCIREKTEEEQQQEENLYTKHSQQDQETYYNANHIRNPSCSSSDGSVNGQYAKPHVVLRKLKSRSAEELGRERRPMTYHHDSIHESIYTEIVTKQDSNEITTGRITRESNNPILRQNKLFTQRSTSLNQLDDLNGECLYGSIDHENSGQIHIQSLDRRYNNEYKIKNNNDNLYENSSLLSSPNLISVDGEIYENSTARPPIKSTNVHFLDANNQLIDISPERICPRCNETQFIKHEQNVIKNQESMLKQYEFKRSTESVSSSMCENVADNENIYDSVIDHEWEYPRERSPSKPIDILHIAGEKMLNQGSNSSFDEIEYKKTVAPFSVSSLSSSVTSSPRGSICSSISSEISSVPPRSMSPPPPLPLLRKKNQGNSSWSNMSTFAGLNYFQANYLGKQHVTKVTRDCIDSSICYVAQHTTLLEMKRVNIEVTHDLIRIGSNASPWELLESFSIEEIMNYEIISKNVQFLGIVAGKPGEEAFCYVLQSEKSSEIADAIKDVFQTVTNKIQRSRSSFELTYIQPEFHRFHLLVKIGSIKVRRSFHCVNDYIKLVLEKVNPKDFRSINLEVLGSHVVISDTHYEEEISHSTPSILSLGVYSKDKRYFGYIISEVTEKKERVQCYVYRAARNDTSAKIIDAISTSYQSAYTPRHSDNCEVNPIYSSSSNNSTSSLNPIYSKYIKPSPEDHQGRNSIGSVNSTTRNHTILNPIYSKRSNHSTPTDDHRKGSLGSINSGNIIYFKYPRTPTPGEENGRDYIVSMNSDGNSFVNGRNSIASSNSTANSFVQGGSSTVSSNSTVSTNSSVGSVPSPHYYVYDSPDASPLNSKKQQKLECSLSSRLESSSMSMKKRLSVDFQTSSIEERSSLIDIDGSTETLLTLTPSPNSISSLPRSSPTVFRKERPKSLPLLDLYSDGEMIYGSKEPVIESPKMKGRSEQKKSKHKNNIFGKFRGSGKSKYTPAPLTNVDLGDINRYLANEPLIDDIEPSTHTFNISYVCSTVVNPPLRPKHVRDCYKQFTKELLKAGKVSHNNGLKTIGTTVDLKIYTDHEIAMLDPNDASTVIRQFPVEAFEKFILHPDDAMGCFAFSTTVPGNSKHKCHLFVMPNDMRNGLSDVFDRIDRMKVKLMNNTHNI